VNSIFVNVNDILGHWMVKKEAMTRSVAAVGEILLEPFDVKTFSAFFAKPDSAVEVYFDIGVRAFRKKPNCLIVP
jgi:hypothetical protein